MANWELCILSSWDCIKPHDVDIMVDSKDIHLIESLFAEYLIESIINTGGWLTKDFGVVFLKARIDIASGPVKSLDIPRNSKLIKKW